MHQDSAHAGGLVSLTGRKVRHSVEAEVPATRRDPGNRLGALTGATDGQDELDLEELEPEPGKAYKVLMKSPVHHFAWVLR